MSRREALDPHTEQFIDAHAKALAMRADFEPLDITVPADMSPALGRMTLTATVEPPTLTTIERHFRETPAGTAVDVLTTYFSLDEAGRVEVKDQQEFQCEPEDGVLPKRWQGPEYPLLLEEGDRVEAMEDLFGAIDEIYEEGRAGVALDHSS